MKKLLYIPVLLLLIACEKEVPFDADRTKSKLVVNALFNTDSLWSVEVSSSKFVLDTGSLQLLDNAQVIISETNGNLIALTNQGNGIYTATSEQPEQGKEYTINVNHNGFDDVSATSSLPNAVSVQNIELGGAISVGGDAGRELLVTFNDSNEEDYYLIQLQGLFWEHIYDTITWKPVDSILVSYPIGVNSNDPVSTDNGGKFELLAMGFTDELFNGTQYTLRLVLPDYILNSEWGAEGVVVAFSTIAEDYYLYETSYQSYFTSQGNPFAQPTQVLTNVKNGHGIFAGYSTALDTLMFE